MIRTILGILILAAAPALAQTPNHKHYADSPDADKPGPGGELAPRLQNLGAHVFPVTTKSRKAQLFMSQGLNLAYGFNHAEAGRAFREAARLDPGCAMAYWGQAFVLGPNINVPMSADDEPKAYEAAQKAVSLKAKASPRERAYIDAVARRYNGKAADRSAGDHAFAAAMKDVVRRFPADLDAATIYAESLMDLRPWNYWTPDGRPYEETPEIVGTLEKVLARSPNHPGANHLYIHAMEATKQPEKAEAAADRLLKLMPGAGHIVHMPSHIYQRVGRYADAAASNDLAIKADEDYITQCRAQGLYPMVYYPHNIHFLWYAATAEGRSQVAIDAARKMASQIDEKALDALPLTAAFKVVPYYALARFGKWDEVLAEPAPADRHVYLTGVWHYARGLALSAKGRMDEADKELAEVRRIAADPALNYSLLSPNTGRRRLRHRARGPGRRHRRQAEGLGRRHRAPRAGRPSRGQPGLYRAGGVALPVTPGAGRGAAGGRPGARGGDGLLGRPAAARQPGLVLVRPGRGAAGAGQEGRGGGRAGEVRQGLGPRGREAHRLAVLREDRPTSAGRTSRGAASRP
jgi:tetratricopeptide (TPR) repeat protein